MRLVAAHRVDSGSMRTLLPPADRPAGLNVVHHDRLMEHQRGQWVSNAIAIANAIANAIAKTQEMAAPWA